MGLSLISAIALVLLAAALVYTAMEHYWRRPLVNVAADTIVVILSKMRIENVDEARLYLRLYLPRLEYLLTKSKPEKRREARRELDAQTRRACVLLVAELRRELTRRNEDVAKGIMHLCADSIQVCLDRIKSQEKQIEEILNRPEMKGVKVPEKEESTAPVPSVA